MRLLWIFVGLLLLFLIPFLVWGDAFEAAFSLDGAVDRLRSYGGRAWMAGLVLLTADLVLPVPSTLVMSALGFLYGPTVGGLLAGGGSFLAGAVAYGLCRLLGRRGAVFLLGTEDLVRAEHLARRIGGWAVVLSRWLPLLPEVVTCMAGLTRMPAALFFPALACGALPMGFVFAAVGHAGTTSPVLALWLNIVLPPVLWLLLRPFLTNRMAVAGRS